MAAGMAPQLVYQTSLRLTPLVFLPRCNACGKRDIWPATTFFLQRGSVILLAHLPRGCRGRVQVFFKVTFWPG